MRDPKVWLGLAITVVAMWFALRDVDFQLVWAEFRRADLVVLLGLSIPAYLMVVWLRALRWRHLTNPIREMPTAALFRATAVGFMANNVFPLRLGEILRPWYLARECDVSPAAVFGTVVLERIADTILIVLIAAFVFAYAGGDSAVWRAGALLLAPVGALPVVVLLWLRARPRQVLDLFAWAARPLPEKLRTFALGQLENFSEGLGALQGGSHLFWIGFHTVTMWLVASAVPMMAGFLALGVEFESFTDMVFASWMVLTAVGIAVAIPSAPGFFGVYHSACRLVLERFGMAPEPAVALGTLLHAVFWITLTVTGLAVLRSRRTRWLDLERAADASD